VQRRNAHSGAWCGRSPPPGVLGGPHSHIMAPLTYWEFASDSNWPLASALAFILVATTLLLTTLANRMIPRR
jgi:putative spermidine/putrescine transport system permease protein